MDLGKWIFKDYGGGCHQLALSADEDEMELNAHHLNKKLGRTAPFYRAHGTITSPTGSGSQLGGCSTRLGQKKPWPW